MFGPRTEGGQAANGLYWFVFASALVVLCLPIFLITYPPLVDYPNHLARTYILHHYKDVPLYQSQYVLSWHVIPNLAIDLIMPALLHVVDWISASRLFLYLTVLSFAIGCQLLGTAWASHVAHDPLHVVPPAALLLVLSVKVTLRLRTGGLLLLACLALFTVRVGSIWKSWAGSGPPVQGRTESRARDFVSYHNAPCLRVLTVRQSCSATGAVPQGTRLCLSWRTRNTCGPMGSPRLRSPS